MLHCMCQALVRFCSLFQRSLPACYVLQCQGESDTNILDTVQSPHETDIPFCHANKGEESSYMWCSIPHLSWPHVETALQHGPDEGCQCSALLLGFFPMGASTRKIVSSDSLCEVELRGLPLHKVSAQGVSALMQEPATRQCMPVRRQRLSADLGRQWQTGPMILILSSLKSADISVHVDAA